MGAEAAPKPWYRKLRYQFMVAALAALLLLSFVSPLAQPPLSPYQVRLNGTIDYFAHNYDPSAGLIPVTPGSHTFWLYSDNYLAALAISRYDARNQSTSNFATALEAALGGYAATLPPGVAQNQYAALNSTAASFGCSASYAISWSSGGVLVPGNGSAAIMTTSNDQSPACAAQNYVDLLLLQAVYYHRLGDATAATSYYQAAARDVDGSGFVDLANAGSATGTRAYQSYKVALYVYATYCLGRQASTTNLAAAESTLLYMQSNSTGGFATSYGVSLSGPGVSPSSGVNTETTALAALALELMISPSSSC